jgi:serine/threonine protein kinase
MKSVMRTLVQCHAKGILHRDVKPGNFLLLNDDLNSPLKAIGMTLAYFSHSRAAGLRPVTCDMFDLWPATLLLASTQIWPVIRPVKACRLWDGGDVQGEGFAAHRPRPGWYSMVCLHLPAPTWWLRPMWLAMHSGTTMQWSPLCVCLHLRMQPWPPWPWWPWWPTGYLR